MTPSPRRCSQLYRISSCCGPAKTRWTAAAPTPGPTWRSSKSVRGQTSQREVTQFQSVTRFFRDSEKQMNPSIHHKNWIPEWQYGSPVANWGAAAKTPMRPQCIFPIVIHAFNFISNLSLFWLIGYAIKCFYVFQGHSKCYRSMMGSETTGHVL